MIDDELEAIAAAASMKPNRGKLGKTSKNKGVGALGLTLKAKRMAKRANHSRRNRHITLPKLTQI